MENLTMQVLRDVLTGLPRDTEIRIVHKKGGTLPIVGATACNGYVTFLADHQASRHDVEVTP